MAETARTAAIVRVHYHAVRAVQALYNIAKTSREAFLAFFPEVFDALFRLCADAEPNVKNAASFLDSFVKVRRLLHDCTQSLRF